MFVWRLCVTFNKTILLVAAAGGKKLNIFILKYWTEVQILGICPSLESEILQYYISEGNIALWSLLQLLCVTALITN